MGAPKAKQSSTLRYARLLSFISITFTLFMLGILGLVYALEQGLSSSIQSRMSLTIELSEQEAASPQASIIQLKQAPWVHHVELISADSAARSLSSLLGEDPTKLLGYNPLQPLMKVYLQPAYTHPDSLEQLMKREPILRRSEGYSDQQTQWSSAARNLQTIRYILWVFLGLHLLVSFLQINTATGLVIYSQRMRIRTLSLLGARPGFVRRPFIGSAMLDGLGGGVIALGLIAGLAWFSQDFFGYALLQLCSPLQLGIIALCVLLVGVLVSCLSSWIATRKYIHMEEAKIHLL